MVERFTADDLTHSRWPGNKTRAEELADARSNAPEVSVPMYKSVSDFRKGTLQDEVERGVYREGGSANVPRTRGVPTGPTQAGVVAHNGSGLRKFADNFNSTTGAGPSNGIIGSASSNWRGSGGTVRQTPELYSPLWLNSNFNLPRDRASINAWSRSFYALNPIVQNSIELHSTYPIAKLSIKCHNPKVEKFFAAMIEEIDLMNVCVQIAKEYWILGEAFVYGELDNRTARWSRLLLQNPDYITVKRSVVAGEPIISLRPDENLRRLVFGQRPSDIEQRRQLDPAIVEHVRKGENIPLNNFYVTHLARRISPYEIRGTGLIVSCFRALMLWDKFRESKFAQADSMVNPLTLVKIGNEEFRPTPTDLDAWRDVFEQATYDKDFKIFTHNAVNVERIGYGTAIYDTSADVTQLIKETYIGLMVPAVLMDGQDTTYANGSVALDVLRQRYMQFRNMMAAFLRKKIFAPISKLNDFYEYVDGEKVLVVPEVDWNHMSLFDMADYIGNLSQLAQGTADQKRVSLQTLYRSLGLDYKDEMRKLRFEDIHDAIRAREVGIMQQMPLNELRALGPEDEIDEITQPAVPGENPYIVPGEGGGGMGAPPPMGGGGLGGILPMPSPSGGPPPAPIGGPIGRPPGKVPPAPGGGGNIGPGNIPKPTPPS